MNFPPYKAEHTRNAMYSAHTRSGGLETQRYLQLFQRSRILKGRQITGVTSFSQRLD